MKRSVFSAVLIVLALFLVVAVLWAGQNQYFPAGIGFGPAGSLSDIVVDRTELNGKPQLRFIFDNVTEVTLTEDGWGDTDIDGNLVVTGALSWKTRTVTTTSATLGEETVVFVDDETAGGTVTLNLPVAANVSGRLYYIKKLGTTGSIVIDPNASETIDGGATVTILLALNSVTIISNGTSWFIL